MTHTYTILAKMRAQLDLLDKGLLSPDEALQRVEWLLSQKVPVEPSRAPKQAIPIAIQYSFPSKDADAAR